MNRIIILLVLILNFSFQNIISEPLKEKENENSKLKQKIVLSLGYVSVTGNTNTASGNIEFEHQLNLNKLQIISDGKFIFTDLETEDGTITRKTEKYNASVKFNYKVKNKKSFFANIGWERDVPSGIDESFSLASGVDFTNTFSKEHSLKTGFGVEAFNEKKINNEIIESSNQLAGYLQVLYNVKLSENNYLKIENQSRMNFNDNEDYRITNNISYLSHINKTLAFKVIYNHDYKNLPVSGKEKINTTTTVNLVFKF